MADDVIVRFGADTRELEAALDKLSDDSKGVSGSLPDVSEGSGDKSEQGQQQDGDKTKKMLQLTDASKEEKEIQSKLLEIHEKIGDVSDRDKEQAAIDAMNESLLTEKGELVKAGMAAEEAQKNIDDLSAANVKLAETDYAKVIAADYEKDLKPVGSMFGNTLKEMLRHQETLTQAVRSSVKTMLGSYVSMSADALASWVFGKLGMMSAETLFSQLNLQRNRKAVQDTAASQAAQTAAVTAGNTARSASDAAAAGEQAAVQGASVMTHAKSAAAAVYDDVSQIPLVGWILAPPAAAAAFSAVAAFSAAGGWERVPYDGAVTELHKDEMVLPSGIANSMRAAFSAAGAYGLPQQAKAWANPARPPVAATVADSSAGGSVTMHYTPSISAIDTRGARDFLDQHGRYIVDVLSRQQRNFAQVKK